MGIAEARLQEDLTIHQVISDLADEWDSDAKNVCVLLGRLDMRRISIFYPGYQYYKGGEHKGHWYPDGRYKVKWSVRGGDGAVSVRLFQVARDGWSAVSINVLDHEDNKIEIPFAQLRLRKDEIARVLQTNDLKVPAHWRGNSKKTTECTDSIGKTDESNATSYERLQRSITAIANSTVHGQKPESIRKAVCEILKCASELDPELNIDALPGTTDHLHELCRKLSPELFKIGTRTFHDYLKGRLRKCTDEKLCRFTGKGESPWPQIFPEAFEK